MRARPLASTVAAIALLVPLAAAATSVSGSKIARVRSSTSGDVFIEALVLPSGGRVCNGTSPFNESESYTFDSDTPAGRVLYAQVLAAYSTQRTVDISGDGTCRSFSTAFGTLSYEVISSVTVR